MYTFSVEDSIADIVKEAAQKENRTVRGQFRHFLLKTLEDNGYLTHPTHKKADSIRQDNQSACCHHSE